MAIKDIVIWPDPILKQVAAPVTVFDDELKQLIDDLSDTMGSEPMAGLSAPQIGVAKRVFLMDIPPEHNEGNGTNGKEVFINPEILSRAGSFTWEEGCMSIPGFRGKVTRAKTITMRYQNEHGEYFTREAFYYLGGCFQHELDHLDGILWIDYQSAMKKGLIRKKMLRLKKMPIEEQRRWREDM